MGLLKGNNAPYDTFLFRSAARPNSVVCFSNVAQQAANAEKGDLVHVTGRVRESSHGEPDNLQYRTELIADTFSILAKSDKQDQDQQ